MFVESHRMVGGDTAKAGSLVTDDEGGEWYVAATTFSLLNGHTSRWLDVVRKEELCLGSVESETPKPRRFAPSAMRDSFDACSRNLAVLGERMDSEFPFGGVCCRDCEWSGHEEYRKLAAKVGRVESWQRVLLDKLRRCADVLDRAKSEGRVVDYRRLAEP